jgi:hypothetical protein
VDVCRERAALQHRQRVVFASGDCRRSDTVREVVADRSRAFSGSRLFKPFRRVCRKAFLTAPYKNCTLRRSQQPEPLYVTTRTARRARPMARTFVVHDLISIVITIEAPSGAHNVTTHTRELVLPSCTDSAWTAARIEHGNMLWMVTAYATSRCQTCVAFSALIVRTVRPRSQRGSCPRSRPTYGADLPRHGPTSAPRTRARPVRAPVRTWICGPRNAHTGARRKHEWDGARRRGSARLLADQLSRPAKRADFQETAMMIGLSRDLAAVFTLCAFGTARLRPAVMCPLLTRPSRTLRAASRCPGGPP